MAIPLPQPLERRFTDMSPCVLLITLFRKILAHTCPVYRHGPWQGYAIPQEVQRNELAPRRGKWVCQSLTWHLVCFERWSLPKVHSVRLLNPENIWTGMWYFTMDVSINLVYTTSQSVCTKVMRKLELRLKEVSGIHWMKYLPCSVRSRVEISSVHVNAKWARKSSCDACS